MVHKISRKWKRTGFTLITALAFSLIVGTVLAGVGTVAVSHLGRSKVEGTYASAVALADAGVNYELRWDSIDPTFKTQSPHQISNPYTSPNPAIPGIDGTFSVYVRDWDGPNHNCDGGNWTDPVHQNPCIVATGTTGGISRTVHIRAAHKSVFDEFVIFAIAKGTFNGGGSSYIVGDTGTNGQVKFNGSTGTNYVQGTLYYNGPGTTGDPSGSNTATNTDPVNFPSVSDWANNMFPAGGLTYLQTHNANASIMQLTSSDTSLASIAKVSDLTLANINSKLASAGYTTASRALTDPTNSTPADSSALDMPGVANQRFAFSGGLSGVTVGGYGENGKRVLFFPPGDYYFTSASLKGGTTGLVFLTHLGNIHIWIDNPTSGPNKSDDLSTSAVFTDYTPSKLRIFYNKCNQLNMTGNSVWPGGFYAVNPGCSPTNPMINIGGAGAIFGSVITDYFTVGGNTQIVFPNNAGGDPLDFALWFGFKDNWQEQKPNLDSSKTVFADGTSN